MLSRSEVYRIYVCGISYDVQQIELVVNFQTFGNICDIDFEPTSHYALISYTNQKDAILAIAKGHELKIGDSDITVEWARGWPINRSRRKIFHSVFDETSSNNSMVYINGLKGQNSRVVLKRIFGPFGMIDIFFTKTQSDFALVRFSNKWNACLAICTIDGTIVDGIPVSCTWFHRENTQSVATGGHGVAIPMGRVKMQAPPLPPTSNTTIRTPAAASSTTNPSATTPALSSSTTGRASTESNTILGSTLSTLYSNVSYLTELFALLLGRRDNATTSTPSSTSATSNFSESSSALSNEEHTNYGFDTVFNQTRLNNCTVYCKGLSLNSTIESLKNIFSPFGIIKEISHRLDYALIRFNTKEAATLAICSTNNTKINGCRVKCTWSNGANFRNPQAQAASVGQPPSTNYMQSSTQAACLPFAPPLTAAVLTKKGGAEKAKERTSDIFCKICMDEELGVVFLPCGHLTACAKCAQQIFTCPLCRKFITSKVRTYLS